MATTPVVTPIKKTFLQTLSGWLPIIESLGNAALTIAGLPSAAQLASAVENAVNPLVATVAAGSTTQQDILAGWASAIGLWAAIGQQTGLDAATKAKVTEYLADAQAALAGAVVASAGYSAGNYAPVTPIV